MESRVSWLLRFMTLVSRLFRAKANREHVILVPQGTKLNELRALVRKHRAEIMGDTVADSAASAFGAATSSIGSAASRATDAAARATDAAAQAIQDAFDKAINTWSDSRLKAFLDARGVVSACYTFCP